MLSPQTYLLVSNISLSVFFLLVLFITEECSPLTDMMYTN